MQIDCIKEAPLPPQGEGQEEGVFIRLLFIGYCSPLPNPLPEGKGVNRARDATVTGTTPEVTIQG